MDFKRLSFYDWRDLAEKKLGKERFAYLTAGAGYNRTVEENYASFEKWRFLPRILKNDAEPDISYDVFGKKTAAPIMLAPIRGLKYFHKDGELAAARAAKRLNIPIILSNFASATIEEIGNEMGDVPHFLQLYNCNDEDILDSVLRRAEAAGYSGLFITVDMASHPIQYRGPKTSEYERYGHDVYFSDPVFRSKLNREPEDDREGALELWRNIRSTRVTWDYVEKIKKKSQLRIFVKGVLHPLDAEECIKLGVDGIVISNHGGRSLDSAVAPLEILPDIALKFRDKMLLFIDCGFRSGVDVLKAIALGAECILLGRSYIYPLAAAGEEGVFAFVNKIIREISSTIQSLGCSKISELGPELIKRI
jgi:lactate 2-monooxygenase